MSVDNAHTVGYFQAILTRAFDTIQDLRAEKEREAQNVAQTTNENETIRLPLEPTSNMQMVHETQNYTSPLMVRACPLNQVFEHGNLKYR